MGRSSCILTERDNLENFPVDSVSCEKMAKEFSQVSDFVHFKLENTIVVVDEGSDKMFFVHVINFAKPLC